MSGGRCAEPLCLVHVLQALALASSADHTSTAAQQSQPHGLWSVTVLLDVCSAHCPTSAVTA